MDILQPLPFENWILLRDSLKRDWPTYAQYYCWVNNAIKWKKKDPQLQHKIFCPHGEYDSGVFIGISSISLYLVILFTFNESKELLQKVLMETKIIDWSKQIMFSAVHEYFSDVLLDFVDEFGDSKNIRCKDATVTYCHFKSKEDCLKMQPYIPEECEIKSLQLSNIELVHSEWPHNKMRNPEITTKFLKSLIQLNRGVGLYLKKDNSLVSWVLHFDWGGLGMLQTVEEHKRKGYGKIVVQTIIKKLAEEENLDSILFVVENNIPSEKLFKSLGYKRLMKATWIDVEPITN